MLSSVPLETIRPPLTSRLVEEFNTPGFLILYPCCFGPQFREDMQLEGKISCCCYVDLVKSQFYHLTSGVASGKLFDLSYSNVPFYNMGKCFLIGLPRGTWVCLKSDSPEAEEDSCAGDLPKTCTHRGSWGSGKGWGTAKAR